MLSSGDLNAIHFSLVELLDAQMARPIPLGRVFQRRVETEHVEAAIAVIAEQQLIVVLRRRANRAGFTFDALPGVALRGNDHVVGELQARRMTGPTAFRARHHRFGPIRLLVLVLVSETEVAVSGRFAVRGYRRCPRAGVTFGVGALGVRGSETRGRQGGNRLSGGDGGFAGIGDLLGDVVVVA